jgi:hypothetical protein
MTLRRKRVCRLDVVGEDDDGEKEQTDAESCRHLATLTPSLIEPPLISHCWLGLGPYFYERIKRINPMTPDAHPKSFWCFRYAFWSHAQAWQMHIYFDSLD